LNEPTILDSDSLNKLDVIMNNINRIDCLDIDGRLLEIINKHEKENLSIRKGSLNKKERQEIESHVLHTYNFVSKIPWPDEYKNIPNITRWHHELLDGSGYPDGLKGEQIPLQSRIMTIADIYDALTAKDRPYKKSIPHSKAIKILKKEAAANKLDKDLVNIFIKSGYSTSN
jgi:HD-GYP domain-containing protein (c-di-GMP phosphodiesterase class II)